MSENVDERQGEGECRESIWERLQLLNLQTVKRAFVNSNTVRISRQTTEDALVEDLRSLDKSISRAFAFFNDLGAMAESKVLTRYAFVVGPNCV